MASIMVNDLNLCPHWIVALCGLTQFMALFRYTEDQGTATRKKERQGKMRRTLAEWEKLWRERWDSNDCADLDSIFADTQDDKDVICEVEIIIDTREGRIETVLISLLDEEADILVDHEYSMYELGRMELVQAVIASINNDPEDGEGGEAETLPESNS